MCSASYLDIIGRAELVEIFLEKNVKADLIIFKLVICDSIYALTCKGHTNFSIILLNRD
jgi:hypothetical protein